MSDFFKKADLPIYMTIPWQEAEQGTAFEMSAEQLGKAGKAHILLSAKRHCVDLAVHEHGGMVTFHVIGTRKIETADMAAILGAIREHGEFGITWAMMQRKAPFSSLKPRDLREILNKLKAEKIIDSAEYINPQGGRPSTRWFVIK